MIATLIDPEKRSVSAVNIGKDISDLRRKIGCTTVGVVPLVGGVDVFVDEEALLKPGLLGFQIAGYPQTLFGRAIVFGHFDEKLVYFPNVKTRGVNPCNS